MTHHVSSERSFSIFQGTFKMYHILNHVTMSALLLCYTSTRTRGVLIDCLPSSCWVRWPKAFSRLCLQGTACKRRQSISWTSSLTRLCLQVKGRSLDGQWFRRRENIVWENKWVVKDKQSKENMHVSTRCQRYMCKVGGDDDKHEWTWDGMLLNKVPENGYFTDMINLE